MISCAPLAHMHTRARTRTTKLAHVHPFLFGSHSLHCSLVSPPPRVSPTFTFCIRRVALAVHVTLSLRQPLVSTHAHLPYEGGC